MDIPPDHKIITMHYFISIAKIRMEKENFSIFRLNGGIGILYQFLYMY